MTHSNEQRSCQQLRVFRQLSGGFRASRVILTANNYAVFEHLKTPKTAGALAKRIKTDPRATEILLDAVAALEPAQEDRLEIQELVSCNEISRKKIILVSGRHAAPLGHALEKLVSSR